MCCCCYFFALLLFFSRHQNMHRSSQTQIRKSSILLKLLCIYSSLWLLMKLLLFLHHWTQMKYGFVLDRPLGLATLTNYTLANLLLMLEKHHFH